MLRRIGWAVLAVFLIAGCHRLTTTGAGDGRIGEPGWPHEKSDLAPDPAVEFGTLPNGFRYVVMNNPEPRDRVSMHLNVQAGSLHETDAQQGLAHFLEHMLFNGSTHFEPGELVKYFQSIGMQFGPDANAHTGFDETVYDILLPDGSPESVEKGLLVLGDYAEGALLLETEIEREKGVILAEKRTRDSAAYRTFERSLRFEFPDSLISRRLPIGLETTIRNADRAALKDYYDTWYRPENMILVLVGDVDPKTAEALIVDRFKTLQPRAPARPRPDIGDIDHGGISAFYHFEDELGSTTVSIETIRKVPPRPDSIAHRKDRVLRDLADRIVQNRLDALVRTVDAPFTSASIGSDVFLQQARYSEISAKGKPENWARMLDSLDRTLRQALAYGFSEAELDWVRKDYLSGLERAVSAAATRESQDLARQLIRHVNSDRVFRSPAQDRDLLAPFVASVGIEAVEAAFRDTWAADHRLVLVTGNVRLDQSDAAVLARYEMSRSQPVAAPAPIRAVAFPYLPEPEVAGTVVDRRDIDDLGLVQVAFANGVRLTVKRTDFKANEVRVNVTFGAGAASEPGDNPGLVEFSRLVINESGLGHLDREGLDRALAGKNTQVVFDVKPEHFMFRGYSVPGELPLLFQLLYAHIQDPAFRSEAFQLARQRLRQQHAELERSVDGAMQLSGRRFLAGGDSRFGFPSVPQLEAVRLEDVRAFVLPPLKQAALEVSVIGDVAVDRVIQTAARYLGSLPDRVPMAPAGTTGPVFPDGAHRKFHVDTKIDKSMVVVAFPTDDIWDIGRTRRLSVLAGVFSDNLREQIREKLGAAYSPYAYNRPSRVYDGYGLFQVVVPTDPGKVDAVLQAVRQIAESLVTEGIEPAQLQRVIGPMRTGIRDMRRTNDYWLDTVMTGATRHPEQLDWARSIESDYGSIAAGEIGELARRYLKQSRSATIVITPG